VNPVKHYCLHDEQWPANDNYQRMPRIYQIRGVWCTGMTIYVWFNNLTCWVFRDSVGPRFHHGRVD
jgi:hypothetical protein